MNCSTAAAVNGSLLVFGRALTARVCTSLFFNAGGRAGRLGSEVDLNVNTELSHEINFFLKNGSVIIFFANPEEDDAFLLSLSCELLDVRETCSESDAARNEDNSVTVKDWEGMTVGTIDKNRHLDFAALLGQVFT